MKFSFSQHKGFTLIEMMVVIAIIALLTGIVTANFSSTRAKSRDAKRISDLGQIQLALELYFDRCNEYPLQKGLNDFTIDMSSSCVTQSGATINMNTFISAMPTPSPQAGQTAYYYTVNNSPTEFFSSDPTDYVLKAVLEKYSEVLNDDVDVVDGNNFSADPGCGDDTTSVFNYCIGPK